MSRNKAGTQEIDGSHNVQLTGDGNTIEHGAIHNHFYAHRSLPTSKVFKLMTVLMESELGVPTDYSLEMPAEINAKLAHNNAQRYIAQFMLVSPNLEGLNEVMRDFPDSQKIISLLQRLYLEYAVFDEHGSLLVGNGNTQLDSLRYQLVQRVITSNGYDTNEFDLEDVEEFVDLLMLYGVMKCKVLKKSV